MEIFFLGTSAAWPLPRLKCACPICASTNPKDKRWRSSIIINKQILVDAGPDFYHQYQKFPRQFTSLEYVFITHKHYDHVSGMHDLSKLNNLKIYRSFKADKTIKISSCLSLKPILLKHSIKIKTYGFLITQNKTAVFYAPDFLEIPPEEQKYLQNVDLAILDGSSLYPAGLNHMPITASGLLAKKLKFKQVFYTHIGHGRKMLTHTALENKIQKDFGRNFFVAWDGLELTTA